MLHVILDYAREVCRMTVDVNTTALMAHIYAITAVTFFGIGMGLATTPYMGYITLGLGYIAIHRWLS